MRLVIIYNYSSTSQSAHLVFRKIAINNVVQKKIKKKFVKNSKTIAILIDLCLDNNFEKSIFKSQDM